MTADQSFTILRRLTGSDLGWFAAARELDRARGRQRGININSTVMNAVFPDDALNGGVVLVRTTRVRDGQSQERPIRLQRKNWRLVGDKVSGVGLDALEPGDYFWAGISVGPKEPHAITWEVVPRATAGEQHARIDKDFKKFLVGGMACWASSDPLALYLRDLILGTSPEEPPKSEVPPSSADRVKEPMASYPLQEQSTPRRSASRVRSKLQRPNILAEIMRSGLALSAKAQTDFMEVLDTLSSELRALLSSAGRIEQVVVDHAGAWADVQGLPIGFVDGGVANVSVLGAAPVAIRVGSYVVTPGSVGPDREHFDFEVQLVDDLYRPRPAGVYEDVFEDVSKLRDAARIACESAGVLSLVQRKDPPAIVLLHGPLVNPVSPYALDGFPEYTKETATKLLPPHGVPEGGREANFVAVYLEQLKRLAAASRCVCGVVERPGSASPGPVASRYLDYLRDENIIDAETYRAFREKLEAYRVTDAVLFECILEEGEYLTPMEVDKQGPGHKIPEAWRYEIESYPAPLTTYVKTNPDTMPIRIETFESEEFTPARLLRLIVHTSRLLPQYAFPVGLDIVDKHAKVPNWMSRQMNTMLSAQMMRKAMESGNPAAVRLVRRILSAKTRDWLFRPDYLRS